ncbi:MULTISPECIES: MFS transporter [Methylobacterium]|uniref:Sulfoacetate transporter SauU n=1 Tax=Methylobacterium bullatum TaxID=570505 RepID=A0A679JAW4_9HYPH|nr:MULTISPECIES: MFS transporter [Methylobacterium]KQP07067.1 MFS transporter [Methylobacterium sp. Leaf93]MBD8903210.1 MFS transporter [Methylobacterium bullatum]TXN27880.1 MFS transporter [Methylobacterium sp. WL19]CAA2136654.1 putative sulfoacetate transporter SauU [Methylobacterium bullatum]GJD40382.1 putative sulfoacetate transporter SauU [Methylobacterium bullatum]
MTPAKRRVSASNMVLFLLCLMYFVTYLDRVNIATAGGEIMKDLGLSNTQFGLILSAFAYPYAIFQVIGGSVGDKFGARRTLLVCGLIWASATILTGFVGGLISLFLARVLLGFGEGATFPTATRAMQNWTAPGKRGFAQGITHAFARLGNAVAPPIVAFLIYQFGWRIGFVILGVASFAWVVVWYLYFRDDPKDHPAITPEELAVLPPPSQVGAKQNVPWGRLTRRMLPVTLTYFCYGWTLWLFLGWLPSFFKLNYGLDLKNSALFASGVFFAGVVGDTLGGVFSDRILKRTGDLKLARLSVIVVGFLGAAASLTGVFFTRDLTLVALLLSSGFFFAELVIGPIWSVPMDIAPKYSGTAAGLMNTGSAVAAIISPIVFGMIVDMTGSWTLPFVGSIGLCLLGAVLAFTMHPERPFEEEPVVPPLGRAVPAE